jgi:predicted metal-dependent hydrolase
MKAEFNHLQFGEQRIEYRVVRRKRKTLEIAVNPDASVVITAPMDASIEAIKQKLRKRAA